MDVSISSGLGIDTNQGYLHRLEDYDTPGSRLRCESERVIFLRAINLPPILIQGPESATVNGRTIERRYPTRTFFVGRVTHRRTRERSVTIIRYETRVIKGEDETQHGLF